MSSQGTRHGSAEPTQPANKRDRRRGAAGRAAALRRAPSDSDCSGETASLSADSGDRAPRPLPQATRSTKSRSSRRRGSEWEVLEGLKDGQRFEKRPEVFNGYLHKKRKWPLKGWHKRFFVIDGGILVYARSPTDVARGRLHGSVDVGLSVISAKQRRRRIDIDADEFIYHLRAKTPDVFRTWLLVLKAHRLYRQHLLTFGARESAPKIHVPLDDLPPTDNSRTSHSSDSFSTITSDEALTSPERKVLSSLMKESYTIVYHSRSRESPSPANEVKNSLYNHDQLLQLRNCFVRNEHENFQRESANRSDFCGEYKTPIHAADMGVFSLQIDDRKYVYNVPTVVHSDRMSKNRTARKEPAFFHCGSSSQSREDTDEYFMKKSKKCTNLVQYKNTKDEPKLNKPLSKCMLLGKYHLKVSKESFTSNTVVKIGKSMKGFRDSGEQVIVTEPKHQPNEDLTSLSEYDKITEKLLITIFGKNRNTKNDDEFVLSFVRQAVKEIYDVKLNQSVHPIKQLFKCLLQYWLLNTSMPSYRDAMQHAQSISIPSMKHFTKDANVSGVLFTRPDKATQFHGKSDTTHENGVKESNTCDYYDKERRIQELEKLMKNTVYTCEIPRVDQVNNKRKMLSKDVSSRVQNSNYTTSASFNTTLNMSSSSSELPQLEETLHNLINDYTIPPTVAKDFLNAYLDMLLTESNVYSSTTSPKSDEISQPIVDSFVRQNSDRISLRNASTSMSVEVILKKSKSTQNVERCNFDLKAGPSLVQFVDAAEQCVPLDAGFNLIEKITAVFTKIYKATKEEVHKINSLFQLNPIEYKYDLEPIAEKDSKYTESDVIFALDLCQYNLHDISISKDHISQGLVAITVVLREKSLDEGIKKSVTGKVSSDVLHVPHPSVTDVWMSRLSILQPKNKSSATHVNNFDTLYVANKTDIQPYMSSKKESNIVVFPSIHSVDSSFQSSNYFKPEHSNHNDPELKVYDNEDQKQCYVLSTLKKKCLEATRIAKIINIKEPTDLSFIAKGDMAQQEKLVAMAKSNPKLIDEKLILLLLENLTLLSQNVPSMHKDVTYLYGRLKKKYDKHLKTCNVNQRLSFLGEIYKNEIVTGGDNVTEFEKAYTVIKSNSDFNCRDVHVSTESVTNLKVDVQVADKSLMAYATMEDKTTYVEAEISFYYVETSKESLIEEAVLNIESLSEDEDKSAVDKIKVYNSEIPLLYTTNSDPSMKENPESSEKATSIQRWEAPKNGAGANTKIVFKVNTAAANFKPPEKKMKEPSTYSKTANHKPPKRTIQSKPPPALTKTSKKVIKVPKSSKVRETLIKDISKYGWWKVAHSPANIIKERKNLAQRHNAVYEVLFNRRASLARSGSGSQLVIPRVSSDDLKTIYRCKSEPSYCSGLISPTAVRGPQAGFVSGTPGGRLASWIIESGGPLENASKELGQAQLSVQQLQRLLDALELQQQVHHDTDVSLEGASPNVKKDRRKFGLRKKKSNSKCASIDLAAPHLDASSSHMALSALTAPPSPGGGACSAPNSAASLPIACAAARPQSLPGAEALGGAGPASLTSLTPDHQLREDFTVLAKDLVANLKSIVGTLVCERGRLRAAMDAADATGGSPGAVASLRTNLSSALQQNSELRSRLSRIHDASDLAEISSVGHNSDPQQVSKHLQQSLSYSSSCVSASEFFDAEEHELPAEAEPIVADEAGVIELDGDSSSEVGSLSSEEGSASSDNSDAALLSAEPVTLRLNENGLGSSTESRAAGWARRKRLPCPRPTPGGPSLWNLLYKNIGKDLSQISMPVTINEPLNMLQRLCEELEYSELLDSASECSAPLERAALVAAFAVSAYAAAAHRAASKPFNPLLAETYECVRGDRDFRFISEQVSHHPPISACHAESPRWCFWQEARIKTKFWGKSMEFQPAGRVHVRLLTTGDHYSWNKVTTCVHNLFGGQRWVDQYGDMILTCHGTDISAKLNFVKASPWSTSRHEVRGAVAQAGAGARLRLQGRWSEGLHAGEPPAARCLWRPGAMPPEHELYYGFTRFAMELNEMEPGMREVLPHTDTRLRPDQRALEEGDVDGAEQFKHRLEQTQRERRRDSPEHTPSWFRKTQEGGEEMWVFNGEYWKAREAGFPNNPAPRIW